jgi:hypothetical protein
LAKLVNWLIGYCSNLNKLIYLAKLVSSITDYYYNIIGSNYLAKLVNWLIGYCSNLNKLIYLAKLVSSITDYYNNTDELKHLVKC